MPEIMHISQIVRKLVKAADSDKGMTGQECWELAEALAKCLADIRDAVRDITRTAR